MQYAARQLGNVLWFVLAALHEIILIAAVSRATTINSGRIVFCLLINIQLFQPGVQPVFFQEMVKKISRYILYTPNRVFFHVSMETSLIA